MPDTLELGHFRAIVERLSFRVGRRRWRWWVIVGHKVSEAIYHDRTQMNTNEFNVQ
jgi:hypothetical protein